MIEAQHIRVIALDPVLVVRRDDDGDADTVEVGEDFENLGRRLGIEIAGRLVGQQHGRPVDDGADLLVLSGGRNIESGWFMFGSNFDMDEMKKVLKGSWLTGLMMKLSQLGTPRVQFREMYFLEYSRRIRAAVVIPLGYLGGARSLANAEQAMAEGFDAVVMARPSRRRRRRRRSWPGRRIR